MQTWQRILFTILIGSFPAAVYLLNRPKQPAPITSAPETAKSAPAATTANVSPPSKANFNTREMNLLDRGIDSKVKEMKEIDIKITETRGEIIRLEEKKGAVRKDLEALQARLAPIIEGVDRRQPSGKSAKADVDAAEMR
jgi:hypothetical protein